MVDHQVHDDAHAAPMGFVQQALDVRHRAVFRVDGAVVADVVAVIVVGGLVDRAQPEEIDAQRLQVVQLGEDAPEVADAVSVAVIEALGVDLVSNCFFPPGPLFGHVCPL